MSQAKAETLSGAVFAPLDQMRSALLVVAFSLLTALSAQVAVPLPFTPVPITGQTLMVLFTGALLGSRLGALAMVAYLAEGAAGLPVFQSGHGGLHYLLFSPTSGYLLSYPLVSFVTGWLAERGWDRRFLSAVAALAVGNVLILLCGWSWFAVWSGSPATAFQLSVAPFIVGDVAKILLAAAALPLAWSGLRRQRKRND